MGMRLAYCRITPHNADLLLRKPILIHRFIGGDEEELPPAGGFWKTLFGGKRTTPENALELEPRMDGDEGDVDKAWNAIHYLLTGSAEAGSFPASFILHGGTEVGEEDVGFGPARVFSASEVTMIEDMLQEHTRESLLAHYDGRAMDQAKVYPQIWGRDGESGFEYLWENFTTLQSFVRTTRELNQQLLIYLC